MRRLLLSLSLTLAFLAACGGGNGGDGDAGDTPDSRPLGDQCRNGAVPVSDSYQPLEVGTLWLYDVTEVGTGAPPYVKRVELTEQSVPPGQTEPGIVQLTTKSNGQTKSWFRRVGDTVVRVREEDYDQAGVLERTTTYEPYRLRVDESAAHLVTGATYTDAYTEVVVDALGVETRTDVIDQWVVVEADTPCVTGWGQELGCVHLHRERLAGGLAIKDHFFARGYGKVREEGGQIEVLSDCAF